MTLRSVMNDTKWKELRCAMLAFPFPRPNFRTRSCETGFVTRWDGEWNDHLSDGGYTDIEWVEIQPHSAEQRERVLAALRKIHLPGEETETGFRIYGYTRPGQATHYL